MSTREIDFGLVGDGFEEFGLFDFEEMVLGLRLVEGGEERDEGGAVVGREELLTRRKGKKKVKSTQER